MSTTRFHTQTANEAGECRAPVLWLRRTIDSSSPEFLTEGGYSQQLLLKLLLSEALGAPRSSGERGAPSVTQPTSVAGRPQAQDPLFHGFPSPQRTYLDTRRPRPH